MKRERFGDMFACGNRFWIVIAAGLILVILRKLAIAYSLLKLIISAVALLIPLSSNPTSYILRTLNFLFKLPPSS